MTLDHVSRCISRLDFSPRRPLLGKSFSSVAINRILVLNAGENRPCLYLEQNQIEASESLAQLFPELSLMEFAELKQALTNHPQLTDEVSLYRVFKLSPSSNLEKTLTILTASPEEFKAWAADKRLAVQDLAPLRLVKDINDISPLLVRLSKSPLSKSEACRALELAIELFLQNQNLAQILELPPHNWLRELEKLRFQNTFSNDEQREAKLRDLPWPRHSQVKFVRRGDRAGLELKLFVSSPAELKTALSSLNFIADKADVWK